MLQKVYLLRSFKLKPQEQDGKQERYLCLIFTGHIYTVEKTHSDITPSLTSFLGSKKKKKTYNIHIHSTHWFFLLPVCRYQYKSFAFRFCLFLSSKCIQDVLYYFATFGRVIMQFSTALVFNKTGVTLCCLVNFLHV